MRTLWLIAIIAALGLAGCERERERERGTGEETTPTTPGAEQPGTVSPAPESPGMQEDTTGETRTPGERTTPRERESEYDTDATESTTPGMTGDRAPGERATEGTATAPARDE